MLANGFDGRVHACVCDPAHEKQIAQLVICSVWLLQVRSLNDTLLIDLDLFSTCLLLTAGNL